MNEPAGRARLRSAANAVSVTTTVGGRSLAMPRPSRAARERAAAEDAFPVLGGVEMVGLLFISDIWCDLQKYRRSGECQKGGVTTAAFPGGRAGSGGTLAQGAIRSRTQTDEAEM